MIIINTLKKMHSRCLYPLILTTLLLNNFSATNSNNEQSVTIVSAVEEEEATLVTDTSSSSSSRKLQGVTLNIPMMIVWSCTTDSASATTDEVCNDILPLAKQEDFGDTGGCDCYAFCEGVPSGCLKYDLIGETQCDDIQQVKVCQATTAPTSEETEAIDEDDENETLITTDEDNNNTWNNSTFNETSNSTDATTMMEAMESEVLVDAEVSSSQAELESSGYAAAYKYNYYNGFGTAVLLAMVVATSATVFFS